MRAIIVLVLALLIWKSCVSDNDTKRRTYSDSIDYSSDTYEEYDLDSLSSTYEEDDLDNLYDDPTIHYDDDYQYEYRTGYSGSYEYNYDVTGYDTYSYDDVEGNLDMQGKYGSGYIEDEYGNEIYVDAEWTDYGVIEATDYEGNVYELETN